MNDRLAPPLYTSIELIGDPAPPPSPWQGLPPLTCLHCVISLAHGRTLDRRHLRLVRIEGQERASELFEYQLELHGNTIADGDQAIDVDDIVGSPLTIGIPYPETPSDAAQPDATYDTAAKPDEHSLLEQDAAEETSALVLFNGIVAAFALESRGVYRLTMRPAMHKLTLCNRYQVYVQQNVRDVIAAVLGRHHVACSMAALNNSANLAVARVQDWLQAGESDFEFVRRLMAKAHLYYYFVHTGAHHTVVFANQPAYPAVFANEHALRYTWTGADDLGLFQADTISRFNYQRSLTASAVHGVHTRQRACWEQAEIGRDPSYRADSRSDPGMLEFNLYKIYQYGCSGDEVADFTGTSNAAMQAAAQVFSGASRCARLRVGHQFQVDGSVDDAIGAEPVCGALHGQRFVLTEVKFEASADGTYENQFQATPAAGLISSWSMQETQQGSVLAEVVRKDGAPPPPDWRGYDADCFDEQLHDLCDQGWRTPGNERLAAIGVYVRFSSAAPDSDPVWVKLAPHMQTMPEPGVTVLVARAQDESELPEIQSIIHNNGTKVVAPLGWTASTHVGSSYSTAYGDGTSVRFGLASTPRRAAAQALVEHAYQSGRYRETSYAQGATYSFATSERRAASASDEAELFGAYGGVGDLLSAGESFGSTFNRHQADVVSSVSDIGTSYSKSTTGRSDSSSHVIGLSTNRAQHDGDVRSDTTIDGDSYTSSTIKGVNVSDNSHFASTSSSRTGLQQSTNAVLVNVGMDVTGASARTTMTGASVDMSVTGSLTSVQVVSQHNSVQMFEENNVVELIGPGLRFSERAEEVKAETVEISVTIVVGLRIFL